MLLTVTTSPLNRIQISMTTQNWAQNVMQRTGIDPPWISASGPVTAGWSTRHFYTCPVPEIKPLTS